MAAPSVPGTYGQSPDAVPLPSEAPPPVAAAAKPDTL